MTKKITCKNCKKIARDSAGRMASKCYSNLTNFLGEKKKFLTTMTLVEKASHKVRKFVLVFIENWEFVYSFCLQNIENVNKLSYVDRFTVQRQISDWKSEIICEIRGILRWKRQIKVRHELPTVWNYHNFLNCKILREINHWIGKLKIRHF